jgi:hypothetical protein
MNHHFGSPDPPRTLAERLTRLNDNLQVLGERLKNSIAGVVGDAIADAVRHAVRNLLGRKELPADLSSDRRERRDHHAPSHYRDRVDDPWGEEDFRWEDDEVFTPVPETPPTAPGAGQRWRNAMSAAVQGAFWYLKQQPRRRPVLTTLAVTLAAAITGFIAGPVFTAGAGVLASMACLILTADASKKAAELAAG